MGSLGGHLVPGTIFLLIGLWWIYSTWVRYFICRQRRRSFYVTTSFPFFCCGPRAARLPIEAFFIIFGTIVGIIIELIGGFNRVYDQKTGGMIIYEGANNLQHFAMYFMFLLVGIIQVLAHYNFPIPKHFDGVAGCLAFTGEAALFYFHGHARDPIEIEIHVFLVLTICATVLSGAIELIQNGKTVHPTMMRGYCTLLQGIWFYVTAFFLYSPFHEHYDETKDPDPHRTAMLIPFYFVVQMAFGLFVILILAIPAHFVSKGRENKIDFMEYGEFSMVLNNDDDDDDDGDEIVPKLNGTTNIQ